MIGKVKKKIYKYAPKFFNFISSPLFFAIVLIGITSFAVMMIFRYILLYELHHAYNGDSPLYWAVGRGMLNGLTPYSEMYENKPVGLFLITALSFALTGDTILCNVFSCIAAAVIIFAPAAVMLMCYRKSENIGIIRKVLAFLIVILSCSVLAVYVEDWEHAGGFQAEAIGSAASILFICISIRLKRAVTKKKKIILTVFSSLALAFAVMIKEPFLLICIFGALMFVDGLKDFLNCILIPCICGGVAVLALLTVTGTLVPYFTIYVSHMFETRLSGELSVFSKMKSVIKLFKDLSSFSRFLYLLIMFFIILTLIRPLLKKDRDVHILYHVLRTGAALLAASLCVGMGGQYFGHHYIFALPIYCAFIIYGGAVFFEFKPEKDIVRKAMIILWGTVLIIAGVNIHVSYDNYTDRYESIKAKAEYVDEMMDFYEEDRYQYLGFNGENQFFGLTEHSPLGPVFAQDSNNFQTDDTWFAECIKKQLDECDIIIVGSYKMGELNDYVKNVIEEKFTESPAKIFDVSPPKGFAYRVYFRKSKYA